jgi:lipoprotein-anchoring transpeptidase ErfK/SrfK
MKKLWIILFVLALWFPNTAFAQGTPLIVINKKTNELAFYDHGKLQMKERVATGKTNDLTPEGLFTVTVKAKYPYYRKKNIPGGDPRNPLGTRWIGFNANNTDGRIYGVHGTNNPASIGLYISNGCIRMNNQAIERLYEKVPIGAKIRVVTSVQSLDHIAKQYGAIH